MAESDKDASFATPSPPETLGGFLLGVGIAILFFGGLAYYFLHPIVGYIVGGILLVLFILRLIIAPLD